MEKIKWILNQMPKNEDKNLAVMALDNVNQARKFHRSFPQYSVTPLAKLDGMAGQLGLGGLFVKDESYRFGLNAFKVLGHHQQIRRRLAVVRILANRPDQLALHRVKQVVHHVVPPDDPFGLNPVPLGEGLQALNEHHTRLRRHLPNHLAVERRQLF